MAADSFVWAFTSWDDVPVRCLLVRETEKQFKVRKPTYDKKDWCERENTLTKGVDGFETYEEALRALKLHVLSNIGIHEAAIKKLNEKLDKFILNKGM